ncbi:MAG TPA: F0F1 ATP synthase subunit A [Bryobacteraceae bacterium]|nr:F0F1 ATP synthase subunit A [Bryobacteraceae bacterium]
MQHHKEVIWLARYFNQHFPDLGNFTLKLLGLPQQRYPWANFMVMELVVMILIIVFFAYLRPRLSADKPGNLQHTLEAVYQFVYGESEDAVGHGGSKYMTFFGSLFLFILVCNLIGIIPGFESPTIDPSVPCGCAIATFVYYNLMGLRENGLFKYMAHFAGPMWYLAPLMVPIEFISHLARPLSLTVRLYANMYAGEQVTLVFLSLTYFVVPAVFMGLHVFVSLLQAYIFMLLTMMYVSGAVSHEH